MDAARFARIQILCDQASTLAASEQSAFLDASCKDPELKNEVMDMLEADRRPWPRKIDLSGVEEEFGSDALSIPEEFGNYRRLGRIGAGGMGEVWMAEQMVAAGRKVAVKFLRRDWSKAEGLRFEQEKQMLVHLDHPFIAQLFDAGALPDGRPWFAMEYVEEGKNITDYCRDQDLSTVERMELFRQVCQAVQSAHNSGIIHRDLKPSNILVGKDGKPKLLDFGIGKQLMIPEGGATLTLGVQPMTPAYGSPELFGGQHATAQSDVWALGVILYEILTGQHPFQEVLTSPFWEIGRILTEQSPQQPSAVIAGRRIRGDQPDWKDLDVLCLTALHRDVKERYSSVDALILDINHYLEGKPLDAHADSFAYRVGKFMGRHRVAVCSAASITLVVIAASIYYTAQLTKARDAAQAEAARTRHIRNFMLDLVGAGDQQAAPSKELTLATVLDRGTQQATSLNSDPETQAELYQTFGTMYQNLGSYSKAEELLRLGLEKTRVLGRENPQTADALVQLALLRGDQAQYTEAEKLAREALERAKRRNPPLDDPALLNAQSALGRILTQSGSYDQAIALLEPIVKRHWRKDEGTLILLESLTALAVAQHYAGHYDAAESLNRRALELDRQVKGNTHPRVADDLANLATTRATLGHFAEAEALYREAAAILTAWYGPEHLDTVQVESFVALMAMRQGKDSEAEALLRSVLPLQERALQTSAHPSIAFTHDTLGKLALKRGNLALAETEFGRSVEINNTLFGPNEYRTAISTTNLANVLVKEGKYSQAERVVRPAVQALTERPLTGNMGVGVAHLTLGKALLGQKRNSEAEKSLTAAYEILKSGPDLRAPNLQETRKCLVTVYVALHNVENASRFRAELAAQK